MRLVQVLRREILVSTVEPKATTISVNDDEAKLKYTADTEAALTSAKTTAKTKDQYGLENALALTDARVYVDPTTVPSDWKLELNNTKDAKITVPTSTKTADAYLSVTYTLTSGLVYTTTVYVSAN